MERLPKRSCPNIKQTKTANTHGTNCNSRKKDGPKILLKQTVTTQRTNFRGCLVYQDLC